MSIYRKIVWYTKGLREYTRNGYEAASKHFKADDLNVDASDKTLMITGANSGIGKCIALQAAHKGATVHLVCRNKQRGEEVRKEIIDVTGNPNIYLHELDISQPQKILEFANTFANSYPVLDVLVNNAGCMVNSRELTDDGIEKNFATNTLGPHILTTSLISVLSHSNHPRIILVSSGGMLVERLNVKDLQFENMKPFDGTMAYAQNKRQQVILAELYAKQYPKIHASSMHPGWADTPAVQMSMPDFYEKMKGKLRTPEQGADTVVWLALSDAALRIPSGEFFQDRKVVAKHLPLAWTKNSNEDNLTLLRTLDEIASRFIS